MKVVVAAGLMAVSSASAVWSEEIQLPPEVTPALRAACEADVRKLCIDENPTVAKVKSCVARKFLQLGRRCQMQITLAGLRP
jgi:hypothetical protein